MVKILVKVAPDVTHHLLECLNKLYGMMLTSLLYYQKFTTNLKEKGYKMNPFDPCIWNKMI